MRRFFAGLLPLVCLLLTACAEPPTGELAPVDVYLPPETEVRGDAPAERDADPRRRDLYAGLPLHHVLAALAVCAGRLRGRVGALTAEYRSGEDRARPPCRGRDRPAGGEPLSEDRTARTRGGVLTLRRVG